MFRKFLYAASLVSVILALSACSSANKEMFTSDSTSSSVLFGSLDCTAEKPEESDAEDQAEEQPEEQVLTMLGIHDLTPFDQAVDVPRSPSIGYLLTRGVPINKITVSPPAKLRPIEKLRMFQSSPSPTYRTFPIEPLEPATLYEITATWGQCFDGVEEPVLSTYSWSFTTTTRYTGATQSVSR